LTSNKINNASPFEVDTVPPSELPTVIKRENDTETNIQIETSKETVMKNDDNNQDINAKVENEDETFANDGALTGEVLQPNNKDQYVDTRDDQQMEERKTLVEELQTTAHDDDMKMETPVETIDHEEHTQLGVQEMMVDVHPMKEATPTVPLQASTTKTELNSNLNEKEKTSMVQSNDVAEDNDTSESESDSDNDSDERVVLMDMSLEAFGQKYRVAQTVGPHDNTPGQAPDFDLNET